MGDSGLPASKGNEKEKQSHNTVVEMFRGNRTGENGHHHLRKSIFVSEFGANASFSPLYMCVHSVQTSLPFSALLVLLP